MADPVCDSMFSSWGFGGRCKPPDGARGATPEANAFWQLLLLFLWLFPSSGVAAMVVDRLFPVSPVSFIALSQSYSLHVPLAHILPPCLWSPSLPFPRSFPKRILATIYCNLTKNQVSGSPSTPPIPVQKTF